MQSFFEFTQQFEVNIPPNPVQGMSNDDWSHQVKSSNVESIIRDAEDSLIGDIQEILKDAEVYSRIYTVFKKAPSYDKLQSMAKAVMMQELKRRL